MNDTLGRRKGIKLKNCLRSALSVWQKGLIEQTQHGKSCLSLWRSHILDVVACTHTHKYTHKATDQLLLAIPDTSANHKWIRLFLLICSDSLLWSWTMENVGVLNSDGAKHHLHTRSSNTSKWRTLKRKNGGRMLGTCFFDELLY